MKLPAFRCFTAVAAAIFSLTAAQSATASQVSIEKQGNAWRLLREGKPYFVKGAGGDGSKQLLHECGGNSFRTWGVDGLGKLLDEAQKYDMTVSAGIWLGHKEHGFDYHNAAAVAAQQESARHAIEKHKAHAALLLWSIGNEMETGQADDPAVWEAVEAIAKLAKELDPNHPTMTVIAEIGGRNVENINKFCPSIDIIGINTYGGGPSIAERYLKAGGSKPYLITEYGPAGTWEVDKNAWGTVPELTSTEKAARYRETYEKTIANQPLSLGSYAFTWGNKQEATSTWFGLLLPDGSKLGAVDALTELWSGHPPKNHAPEIKSLNLIGSDKVGPGATLRASLDLADAENNPLKVEWILQADPATYATGGGAESVPPVYPEAIVSSDSKSVEVKMPAFGGGYRLFAFAHDGQGGAAVGNIPLFVEGGGKMVVTAPKATLPFAIYEEAEDSTKHYVPSGYMGNAAAIKLEAGCTDNPHAGTTCLKVDYTAADNWGGVVWQSPANDWGDQPGGYDLNGAKKLTFWVRGAKGGEVVSFSLGLLGKDKKYPDSASNQLEKVRLSDEWNQFSIQLKGQDLSCIKTAFAWTIGSNGAPITFYLDDIRYE